MLRPPQAHRARLAANHPQGLVSAAITSELTWLSNDRFASR